MKNLILLALVFASTFAQANEGSDFQCVNNMYREARFDIVADRLFIQDSAIRKAEDLQAALKSLVGFKGDLNLHQVSLEIADISKICSSPLLFLVNCDGASTEYSYLHVKGTLFNTQAGTVRMEFSVPVQTKEFKLNSHLTSQGPINLGGTSAQIELKQLQVNSSAKVLVGKKLVELEWDTFFYTEDKRSNGSFCKKL